MKWLWLEKNCHYILEQRSPRHHLGNPDVIGVTSARFLIEIEIKRSRSDFKADAAKHCRRNRELFPDHMAKHFYYLMPRKIAEPLLEQMLIPEWAGLLTEGETYFGQIAVLKSAPANNASKRLSLKECVKMTRCMTNHMMSCACEAWSNANNWKQRDSQSYLHYVKPQAGIYEI